jgi:hypothetical protein
MRTIICYNDIHRYGPHPMDIELKADHNHYFLGDNIDLSHCLKKDVPMALGDLRYYRQAFAGRFVRGNHELNAVGGPDWLKVDNTLLTHGDFVFWPKRYAVHYRKRPRGVSLFRRWLSFSGMDPLRHVLPEAKLHRRTKRKLALLAKSHRCTMIVCAHRHPKEVIDTFYHGVRIVVLPPGKNKVVIE